jgi:hypothetical protein
MAAGVCPRDGVKRGDEIRTSDIDPRSVKFEDSLKLYHKLPENHEEQPALKNKGT